MRNVASSLLAAALLSFPGTSACWSQAAGNSVLPATAPTQLPPPYAPTAPLSAVATPGDRPGAASHRARVSCENGTLAVHAENSSLNGILRGVARCTGMKITGSVADQRVFGDYGPAAPATVLATLLDGTGSNMLLQETAADQPAQLILTPRTGVAAPPSAFLTADDEEAEVLNSSVPAPRMPEGTAPNAGASMRGQAPPSGGSQMLLAGQPAAGQAQQIAAPGQTPVPTPIQGSVVTTPVSIPLPINNVNGSSLNSSPSVGTYPTTNSVPIDSLPTPSTTPSASGIVDAPNPPPAGSDTAALLRGVTTNMPGTTNISPDATSTTSTPGGTNTTVSAPPTSTQPPAALTPEQIYQQLQQLRQPIQAQPATQSPSTPQ